MTGFSVSPKTEYTFSASPPGVTVSWYVVIGIAMFAVVPT
jgi:hypothetical protein